MEGQKPFTCQVCGKSYTKKYTLQAHQHTNDHFASGDSKARSGMLALMLARCRIKQQRTYQLVQPYVADADPEKPYHIVPMEDPLHPGFTKQEE